LIKPGNQKDKKKRVYFNQTNVSRPYSGLGFIDDSEHTEKVDIEASVTVADYLTEKEIQETKELSS
jgi:hypothetical protein